MSIKMLVADDSITIQKVIGIIFSDSEYSLTIVDNGRDAVNRAQEVNPDIFLVDVLMPGMSGYEVAETIRSVPALAGTPILMLTGSFEPFDEERAKNSGADDFIVKPFESHHITAKVRRLLDIGAARKVVEPEPAVAEQSIQEEKLTGTFRTPAFMDVNNDDPFGIYSAPAADSSASIMPSPAALWSNFTVSSSIDDVSPTANSTVEVPSVLPEPVEIDEIYEITELSEIDLIDQYDVAPLPLDSATIDSDDNEQTQPEQSHCGTGSPWIPVDENSFEFGETAVSRFNTADLQMPASPVQESAVFDEFSFEEEPADSPSQLEHVLEQPDYSSLVRESDHYLAPPPEINQPVEPDNYSAPPPRLADEGDISFSERQPVAPSTSTAKTEFQFSDEQLRAAISDVSKEVIERVVREVVPDIAEAIIREAIRKIREGA